MIRPIKIPQDILRRIGQDAARGSGKRRYALFYVGWTFSAERDGDVGDIKKTGRSGLTAASCFIASVEPGLFTLGLLGGGLRRLGLALLGFVGHGVASRGASLSATGRCGGLLRNSRQPRPEPLCASVEIFHQFFGAIQEGTFAQMRKLWQSPGDSGQETVDSRQWPATTAHCPLPTVHCLPPPAAAHR